MFILTLPFSKSMLQINILNHFPNFLLSSPEALPLAQESMAFTGLETIMRAGTFSEAQSSTT